MIQRTFAILAATAVAISAVAVEAQTNDAATTVSNTIQTELGVFVYPRGEQDSTAQAKDTVECYESAKQRTGIDPKAPPPAVEEPEQQKGGAVKGAARGAARGAAIGAVADDTSKGASVGATGGAMRGRQQQKQANAQAQQQAEQQATAAAGEQKATFNKAFSACMDARDYSVK
ncbi:MAG: hypothetical protein JRE70_10355 [Deltaproteobacteria bacterium]|nr:hypothetical protein [Deltaproteobacteria bacterium]